MSTNYPTALDSAGTTLPYPTANDDRNSPSLSSISDNEHDAIIATETKLGIGSSLQSPTNGFLLAGTGTGTSEWSVAYPAGTIVGTTDTQTLTNKTLTSPIINSPTISSPTITGSLGNISTGTLTSSGLITANNGITASGAVTSSGLITANGGLTVPTGQTATIMTALYNPYKFSYYLSNATSGGTQVIFNVKNFDTGNNYSTTTGNFTAPIAGFYFFTTLVTVYESGGASGYSVSINKNGVAQAVTSYIVGEVATAYNYGLNATVLLQLNSGDTVGVSTAGLTSSISTSSTQTYFNGFLISAT